MHALLGLLTAWERGKERGGGGGEPHRDVVLGEPVGVEDGPGERLLPVYVREVLDGHLGAGEEEEERRDEEERRVVEEM